MDLQAVCVGLAAAAAGADVTPSLIAYAYTPDSVETPCCFVAEYEIDYDKAMGRALDVVDVTMRALVGRADDRAAAAALNGLLSGSGTTSLKAAIEADRRQNGGTGLGGACDDYRVERVQGMRWYIHDQITYLGAELRVHVIGSST